MIRLDDLAPVTLLRRFLPTDGSPAMFLHRSHSRDVWKRRGFRIIADLLLSFVVWPLITLGSIGRFTRRNGRSIAQRTGKGLLRQIVEQLHVAFRFGVPPRSYYVFELHDDERRRKARQYLLRFEMKGGIYPALKKRGRTEAAGSPLGDKLAFTSACLGANLPVVPVVLALKDGAGEGHLPPVDLFVKPRRSKGGKGAERWDYRDPGSYVGSGGALLSAAELRRRLEKRSFKREGCLVQPRVVNHAALADLSSGALLTVRLTTCLDESGGVEVTHAVFRMARGRNAVVDNVHAGGIAARVDLQSGELSSATDLGAHATVGWCDRHPDNDAAIRGRRLPLWSETLALVRRAHTTFPAFVVIGWDVALLDDGPRLLEANGGSDLDIAQRTHREPLGNARLGQLLAFHLGRIPQKEAASPTQAIVR